ncbi:PaaI family thioesterase [uncultured Halopseudomonas sp.]|uniref:PaaI family thioesterase n=1 Tax=uncultured Halopseudomonas sp. TaxID=2901193 RepID=UPI0030EEF94B|tara:strand:+ start:2646 stop:3062 length:417 start_codon:yes stop_codon:yes gene_type:complete
MNNTDEWQGKLQNISRLAQFNTWLDLEVVSATEGEVTLGMRWKKEMGQYNGFLHAGIQGALIDTACGFAAATLSGNVLASQFTVRCLRPAVGQSFRVVARVLKPGRQQIFTTAELYATDGGEEKLVATGDTLLVPVQT